jgi:hypothetical protein
MRGRKAQQSVELMMAFSAALAVFIIFYAILAQTYADSIRKETLSEGISLADGIAAEIDVAARAGDGYNRKITYSTVVMGGQSYNLSVNNRSGSVEFNMDLGESIAPFYYSAPTLARSIVGESMFATVDGFAIEAERGYAYIENRNGTIHFVQMRAG